MAASSNELNSVSFSDSEEQDEIALLCLLLIRRRRRRLPASCRKTWTKRWIMRREAQGAFNNLIRELNAEDPQFQKNFGSFIGWTGSHLKKFWDLYTKQLLKGTQPCEMLLLQENAYQLLFVIWQLVCALLVDKCSENKKMPLCCLKH